MRCAAGGLYFSEKKSKHTGFLLNDSHFNTKFLNYPNKVIKIDINSIYAIDLPILLALSCNSLFQQMKTIKISIEKIKGGLDKPLDPLPPTLPPPTNLTINVNDIKIKLK